MKEHSLLKVTDLIYSFITGFLLNLRLKGQYLQVHKPLCLTVNRRSVKTNYKITQNLMWSSSHLSAHFLLVLKETLEADEDDWADFGGFEVRPYCYSVPCSTQIIRFLISIFIIMLIPVSLFVCINTK